MARRIDIELTSARPDGSWTWRAAGALKPRGVLEGSLLYSGAKAGDVVRADAEFEVEGITIVGVMPPKEKKRSEPERLEVVGPPREPTPGVTASLTGRPDRGRDRADGRPRPPRRDGDGPPRREGERSGPSRPQRGEADRGGTESGGGERGGPDRGGRTPGPGGPRPARDRPARERPAGPPREPAGRDAARRERPARPVRPQSDGRPRSDRPARSDESETHSRAKARRLNPGSIRRNAVLESLPPEQRPIAEQVLRGGIPAVRTAIHLEREKATVEGRMPPNAEALLGIAEELLPRLKAAEWLDRAEAAAKITDELALRDLRSLVAGADMARDDESRQLAVSLREALERRVTAQRQEWLDDVTANLDDGRVVRALRVSARPPDPGSRFPAELASRLAVVAGEAMAPDTPPERWAALLEAVAASPVRRSVKPVGLPPEPGEALLHAARQSSGRIPALAPMLGISIPPPPGPARPMPRGPRPGGRPGGPGRPTARPPVPAPPAASRPATTPDPDLGPGPAPASAAGSVLAEPEPSVIPDPDHGPGPAPAAESVLAEPEPSVEPESAATAEPAPAPVATADPVPNEPEPAAEPPPIASVEPDLELAIADPEPAVEPAPAARVQPEPAPEPVVLLAPVPEPLATAGPEPESLATAQREAATPAEPGPAPAPEPAATADPVPNEPEPADEPPATHAAEPEPEPAVEPAATIETPSGSEAGSITPSAELEEGEESSSEPAAALHRPDADRAAVDSERPPVAP